MIKEDQIQEARIKAMETALYGNRLLEEKYFSRASSALSNKRTEDFHALCLEAGIPNAIWERIYEALLTIQDEPKIW